MSQTQPQTQLKVQATPLKERHESLGGKMVDFAGWYLPVEFSGLRQEHNNVRQNVGLFDVSHMGEIRVQGPQALETLEWLTTNHVAKLEKGQAQYSLLTNFEGGIVDDLIVYCVEKDQDYLLCVNAANKDKDFDWMIKNNKGAEFSDESSLWGQIAVQGPKAMALVAQIFGEEVHNIKSFCFAELSFQNSASCLVARTGYTGEDGVEIFVPQSSAVALWDSLLEKGQAFHVLPCGLGARDTLRTEMKLSLYGHEIDDTTNPYEAGLGWVVKAKVKDFIGKTPILAAKEQGLQQKLVGFKVLEKGIARQGYPLFSFDNQEIGRVTSGTLSPTLNENIGIGYVEAAFAELGTQFLVGVRNRRLKVEIVKTPFVRKDV